MVVPAQEEDGAWAVVWLGSPNAQEEGMGKPGQSLCSPKAARQKKRISDRLVISLARRTRTSRHGSRLAP